MQIDTMTIWSPDLAQWPGPRYQAIASAIGADIARGTLVPGAKLPPQRLLADRLGVTVGTVSRGYMLAAEQGLLSSSIGRGTFVRDGSAPDSRAMVPPGDDRFVDLSVNMPLGSANARALSIALQEIAGTSGIDNLLRYMPPEGHAEHRAAAAAWIARTGFTPTADRLVLTQGAQLGIAALFDVLTASGDTVLVESLTYPGLIANARLKDVRLAGVELDAEGMLPDALESAIEETGARVVVLVPTIQNPTTAIMGEERRRDIAAVAERHGITIVEDDVYGYLPEQRPMPIAALLPEQTVYLSSASKCLAPGLRVGWIAAPLALVEKFAEIVYSHGVAQPALNHEILRRWIDGGTAESLLRKLRRDTEQRQALAGTILEGLDVRAHPASFHVLLHLPQPWRRDELVAAALAENIRVASVSSFAIEPDRAPEAVRLSLAPVSSHGSLQDALLRLRNILDRGHRAGHSIV